jgi:hypothetical protein
MLIPVSERTWIECGAAATVAGSPAMRAASDCGNTSIGTSRFNFESRARYTWPIPLAPRRQDLVRAQASSG